MKEIIRKILLENDRQKEIKFHQIDRWGNEEEYVGIERMKRGADSFYDDKGQYTFWNEMGRLSDLRRFRPEDHAPELHPYMLMLRKNINTIRKQSTSNWSNRAKKDSYTLKYHPQYARNRYDNLDYRKKYGIYVSMDLPLQGGWGSSIELFFSKRQGLICLYYSLDTSKEYYLLKGHHGMEVYYEDHLKDDYHKPNIEFLPKKELIAKAQRILRRHGYRIPLT